MRAWARRAVGLAVGLIVSMPGGVAAQQPNVAAPPRGGASAAAAPPAVSAALSPEAQAVKALDIAVEAAFQRADVVYLREALADDFQFWISTGRPLSKAQVLASYSQPGRFPLRKASSIDVELHGNVALVNGRLEVRSTVPREYVVCYLRLYQQRGTGWTLVSHRTFRERDGFGETCAPVDR